MAIPQNREDLMAMGYVFDNEAKCRGCGAPIEWWITPKGKKMPMSVKEVKDGEGFFAKVTGWVRLPHWSDCEAADQFRRKSK
jgi:hypothetical protein